MQCVEQAIYSGRKPALSYGSNSTCRRFVHIRVTLANLEYVTPGEVVHVCDGGELTIDCGSRVTVIERATYGRRDSTTCSPSDRPSHNTNCTTDVMVVISDVCFKRNTCQYLVSRRHFIGLCPVQTTQYLTVEYQCVEGMTSRVYSVQLCWKRI